MATKKEDARGLDFSHFKRLFLTVRTELQGKIEGQVEGNPDLLAISFPGCKAPVNVNLDKYYQGCGYGPSATETTCLAELKRVLQNIISVLSDFPTAPPLSDLFIAVKTSSFVRDFEKNRGADFSTGSGRQARMIAQHFSSQSGELVKAVVIAQTESDYYISDEVLKWWYMSESEAFEVAMQNTDRATPDPFKINHATMGKNARMRAFFRRQKQNPFEICCMRSADRQERPLFVWGTFQDNHALSRLKASASH
jgi:hypothetical protein